MIEYWCQRIADIPRGFFCGKETKEEAIAWAKQKYVYGEYRVVEVKKKHSKCKECGQSLPADFTNVKEVWRPEAPQGEEGA